MPLWKQESLQSVQSIYFRDFPFDLIKVSSLLWEYNHNQGEWPGRRDSLWTDLTLFALEKSGNSPPEGPAGQQICRSVNDSFKAAEFNIYLSFVFNHTKSAMWQNKHM